VNRADAVAAASEVARHDRGRARWIGIDGPGAAGKSTLARLIAHEVEGAVVVSIDEFWGPSISEWDWPRFTEQLVNPLVAGRDARYQGWDWAHDRAGPWHEVAAGSVVVVEGVSSTREEVDVVWDLTIWVDAPADIRRARARARDGDDGMARWLDDWIPSEQRYIATQRPQARVDLVVSGVDLGVDGGQL
jgi:uridine kinase